MDRVFMVAIENAPPDGILEDRLQDWVFDMVLARYGQRHKVHTKEFVEEG
jgi:hypothetical protein